MVRKLSKKRLILVLAALIIGLVLIQVGLLSCFLRSSTPEDAQGVTTPSAVEQATSQAITPVGEHGAAPPLTATGDQAEQVTTGPPVPAG
ncbi:MAG: hypothetical protein U9R72_02545 [Chloroflexota bacterium]|nr:hypothetical protein [Chloroflexota bacterium]